MQIYVFKIIASDPFGSVESPYPELDLDQPFPRDDFARSLCSKYGLRNVLRGGPIVQPAFFYLVSAGVEDVEAARKRHDESRFMDRSFPSALVDPKDYRTVDYIAERFCAGLMRQGIVFKPNFNANGSNIFFLELLESGSTLFTMSNRRSWSGLESAIVQEYLRGVENVKFLSDQGQDIFQAIISSDCWSQARVVREIWRILSIFRANTVSFDPGLVEEVVPLFRPEGRGYETRHHVWVDMRTGQMSFREYDDDGEFRTLIPFETNVEERVRELLGYFRLRLHAAGIELEGDTAIDVDFGWLADGVSRAGFPVPFLTEATISDYWMLEAQLRPNPLPCPAGMRAYF